MTPSEQALSLLSTARQHKRESAAKRRNAKLLMQMFQDFCQRSGIDPAEIIEMQDTAESNHGRRTQASILSKFSAEAAD